MPKDDIGDWAVTWRTQGKREIADMPSEFEARQFAQICVMLTDVTDVYLLPPVGRLDIAPPPDHSAALM